MKTKQDFLKATFTTKQDNAKNLHGEKELTSFYKIIDKKTEKVVVDCRCYMARSRSAQTVYCALWIALDDKAKPASWEYGYTSGKGLASGYGYHKESAAIQDAIESAGIELWGSPYNQNREGFTFKKSAYIGGCGTHEEALKAIAFAAGYNNCIFVRG